MHADEIKDGRVRKFDSSAKGKKTSNGKTIMMSGHMDEIGLMVTHIDEKGFLRFTAVGGVNPGQLCIGGRVKVLRWNPGCDQSSR